MGVVLGWIVFGFFAGLIARAVMPGEQKMGFIKTTLLGIGGAFAGGAALALLRGQDPFGLHTTGFLGAIVGALGLLLLGRVLGGK